MNRRKPPIKKKKKRTWNFSNPKKEPPSNENPTSTATPQPTTATPQPTTATPQPTTATPRPIKVRKTNLEMLKSDAWGTKRYNGAAYSAKRPGNKHRNRKLFDNLGNVILDCPSLKDGIENNLCCKVCAEEERRNTLDDFVTFCDTYTFNSVKEASEVFKRNKRKYNKENVKLTVDTVGIATKMKCSCN